MKPAFKQGVETEPPANAIDSAFLNTLLETASSPLPFSGARLPRVCTRSDQLAKPCKATVLVLLDSLLVTLARG